MFLTRYTRRPLHLFGAAGVIVGGLGLLTNLYLTVLWLLGERIGYRPLLQLGVLLSVVGVQLVFTGLIGEMVADRGFEPENTYSVRETL